MANPITYNGITYPSLASFARQHNFNISLLTYYIKKSNSLQEAIDKYNTVEYVEVFGKKYPTLEHVVKHYGVSRKTINHRLEAGDTLEEAIKKGTSNREVTVFGKTHKTLTDLANYYNLNINAFKSRLANGETLEGTVKSLLNKEPIIFEGKEYTTFRRLCEDYLIDNSIVVNRITIGWSLYEAVTRAVEPKSTEPKYKIKGVYYASKREACEAHGLSAGLVKDSVKYLTPSFEQNLELLYRFFSSYGGNKPKLIGKIPYIIYNGEWYLTVKDYCDAVGLTPTKLSNFMGRKNISSPIVATQMMKNSKKVRWYDAKTGELQTLRSLTEKYKANGDALLSRGYAIKKTLYSYPTCVFKSGGYCATPAKDFKEYLIKSGIKK